MDVGADDVGEKVLGEGFFGGFKKETAAAVADVEENSLLAGMVDFGADVVLAV